MTKKEGAFSGHNTIIWIGLLIGLGYYVADIFIDVFIFRNGTLIEETLSPVHGELIFMRPARFSSVARARGHDVGTLRPFCRNPGETTKHTPHQRRQGVRVAHCSTYYYQKG